MRLVAWNCNMALHRKLAALMALKPDVAVLSECASPARLTERLGPGAFDCDPVWIGANRDKGLAVLGFNGYRARLADDAYRKSLRFIAPVRIEGPLRFNLLAVWAQNFSDGIRRKRQPGPLRLALARDYRSFLGEEPAIVAGDFNNNIFWDRPGYLINHSHTVMLLERYGLGRRDRTDAVLARPPQGWADLSHRLRLRAADMGRWDTRDERGHVRRLVRRASERPRAAGRRRGALSSAEVVARGSRRAPQAQSKTAAIWSMPTPSLAKRSVV
jgi:hypothetical protein